MLRKFIGAMAIAAFIAAPVRNVSAQVSVGYTDIGAVVGIGNLGSANVAFGGRFEHIFKALPDLGNGLLGIEVSADIYSFSSPYYSVRYIPIGGTANYHFKLDEKKLDLFLGAGLGYNLVSCTNNLTTSLGCGYAGALYFIGRAGGRYFFSPTIAAYGDLGAGAATVNLGLTFKLK